MNRRDKGRYRDFKVGDYETMFFIKENKNVKMMVGLRWKVIIYVLYMLNLRDR